MATPTANPFPALQATLRSKVYLDHTPSYHTQLWVMTGVYAASLVLTIVALVLRARRGGFWLYRMHATAYGSWITPNAMVCWLLYSGIFQVFAQVYIYYAHTYGMVGSNIKNAVFWRCFLWTPIWIGGLTMTYSTSIGPILQASASGDPMSGWTRSLARHPTALSVLFVSVHVVVLGLLVPFSAYTNMKYTEALRVGTTLERVLADASTAYEAGQLAALSELERTITALEASLEHAFVDFVDWWRATFIVYACTTGAMTVVFICSAVSHYQSLETSIRKLKEKRDSSESYDHKLRKLIWGHRSLVFTTFNTVTIAGLYFGIVVFISSRARAVAHGTFLTELFLLLSLYVFAVFGTTSNTVILVRSLFFTPEPMRPLASRPRESEHRGVNSAGVTITQEIITIHEYSVAFDMVSLGKATEHPETNVAVELGRTASTNHPIGWAR